MMRTPQREQDTGMTMLDRRRALKAGVATLAAPSMRRAIA
jgi:hypothetical protein